MKYSSSLYSKAFLDIRKNFYAGQDETKLIRNFLKVVKKNNDWFQIDKIFKEICKMAVKERGGKLVKIEFARPVSKELIEKIKSIFSEKDLFDISFYPHLVAGIRILLDDELELDNSIMKKIRRIFKD